MTNKELNIIRSLFGIKRPVSKKNSNTPVVSDEGWDADYWDMVRYLYGTGAGVFLLGLLLAIIVAGIGMIVLAILMWALATLMVITYPIWAIIHYTFNKAFR